MTSTQTFAKTRRLVGRAEWHLANTSPLVSSSTTASERGDDRMDRWRLIALQGQLEKAQKTLQGIDHRTTREDADEAARLRARLGELYHQVQTLSRALRAGFPATTGSGSNGHRSYSSLAAVDTLARSSTAPPTSTSIYASLAAGLGGLSDDSSEGEESCRSTSRISLFAGSSGVQFLPRPRRRTRVLAGPDASAIDTAVSLAPTATADGSSTSAGASSSATAATTATHDSLRQRRGATREADAAEKLSEDAVAAEYGAVPVAPAGAEKDIYPPPRTERGDSSDPATSTLLQSSRAVQESLSGELLRMASILKKNSFAFADALERDRKLVETAGEQLAQNLGLMTRARGRLGEYSKTARGMGWMTLGCLLTVLVSWIWVFVLIKLT
ncbi:hypothetical protein K437DRAFT_271623 [Tilletiaria anomala UBC 951]|uniref:t-SNARE coiled-coil homology domain-containing protein n=1 Tax=Tilletiaria anomala (strain ATCC 24038 / CBS 436.72 / UBC 951) TaxID=1037660 RepID=A0A066WLE5_TILAU|nr:uncharacterized protein K437DRAFT_271623 [Tilletiaria anomala UBC 951]KDN53393.1 hypothetical protein K437DRAFT_271623 [Tilletiaria anomala UBC 951]